MSQKSLLIVDDDQTMSDLIADTLETDFSDVDTCKSISTAKDMLLEKFYDCIIVDIELEDGNGAEVIKYVKDWDPGGNKEAVKILISGFINDGFKEKFKDKFDGILAKPFKPGDLQGVVLIALGKRGKRKAKNSDLSLVGEESTVSKEQNATDSSNSQKKENSPAMDLKIQFDNEEIDLKVFDPQVNSPFKLENLNKKVNKTLEKVQKNTKLRDLFTKIKADPDDPYMLSHIGLLINISTGISHELDWGSDATLEKFVFTAYLHDLSLGDSTKLAKIDDLSKLDDERLALTEDEKKLIRLHPAASRTMIEHKAGIPQDVLTMIEQHHELPNGQGFPRGIDHKRITPLSSVFIFSHWLTDFIINDKNWSVDKFYMKYKTKIKGPHFRKAMRAIEKLR